LDLICPAIGRDLARFEILLASYRRFWRAPGRFHVFVPDSDRAVFAAAIRGLPGVVLRSKREAIGTLPYEMGCAGWFRQQMVKLGAARLVEAPVYCAIDADCFLAAPVTDDLNEDAIPWQRVDQDRQEFYRGAAEALGLEDLPARRFLWRPPFFFGTRVVRAALERIEKVHGESWQEVLARQAVWAEVAVYHLMVRRLGIESLHIDAPSLTHEPIRWPHVDVEADFAAWNVDETFGGSYRFGVIHSNTAIDPKRVAARLAGRFDG